jgi:hypothetical protein
MVAARRIIASPVETDQRRALVEISRSRTEPANRVERAGIILAYLAEPSAYAGHPANIVMIWAQDIAQAVLKAADLVKPQQQSPVAADTGKRNAFR